MSLEVDEILSAAAQLNVQRQQQSATLHYTQSWARLVQTALVKFPFLIDDARRIEIVTAITAQLFAKVRNVI